MEAQERRYRCPVVQPSHQETLAELVGPRVDLTGTLAPGLVTAQERPVLFMSTILRNGSVGTTGFLSSKFNTHVGMFAQERETHEVPATF